jgi:hypothetical protein
VPCDENQSESRMPEIGTSGSMSGDGKRGVAESPKLPRPSSTLPLATNFSLGPDVSSRGEAEVSRVAEPAAAVEDDPKELRYH